MAVSHGTYLPKIRNSPASFRRVWGVLWIPAGISSRARWNRYGGVFASRITYRHQMDSRFTSQWSDEKKTLFYNIFFSKTKQKTFGVERIRRLSNDRYHSTPSKRTAQPKCHAVVFIRTISNGVESKPGRLGLRRQRAHLETASRSMRDQGILGLYDLGENAHLRLHLASHMRLSLLLCRAPERVQALNRE